MHHTDQKELKRLAAQLADSDFYSGKQPLNAHPAFKELQHRINHPRPCKGAEESIQELSWQDLTSMLSYTDLFEEQEPMKWLRVIQAIQEEMQRRLLRLVPEGEAITGDKRAEIRVY